MADAAIAYERNARFTTGIVVGLFLVVAADCSSKSATDGPEAMRGDAGSDWGDQPPGRLDGSTLQGDQGRVSLTACRDLASPAAAVSWAKGGRYLIASHPLGAYVLDTQDWHVVRTFAKTRGEVVGSALSDDASWAATAGTDARLRIWNVADGRELVATALGANPSVLVGAGESLAVLDVDRAVTVFGKDGVPRWHETWSAEAQPRTIRFSADGRSLLITTAAGIDRRSVKDGGALPTSKIAGGVDLLAVSGDGNTIAVSLRSGKSVQLLSATTGMPVGTAFEEPSAVTALALSDDASVIAVGMMSDGALVRTASGAVLRAWTKSFGISDAAFGADNVALASDSLAVVRLSDASTVFQTPGNGFIWDGSFSTTGRYAFTPVTESTEVWDVARGARVGTFAPPGTRGNQSTTIFSPSGKLLMNYEERETSGRYWDVDTHTDSPPFTYEAVPDYRGPVMQFFPDGNTLWAVTREGGTAYAKTWDASNGKLLSAWPIVDPAPAMTRLSPQGTYLVHTSSTNVTDAGIAEQKADLLGVWDVSRRTRLMTLEGHTDTIRDFDVSPDEKLLASIDDPGLLRLWSLPDGGVVRDFTFNRSNGEAPGNYVVFSPDSRTLAVAAVDWGSYSAMIILLSTNDGHEIGRLRSYADANIGRMAFSPDGKHVVAGTGRGARVWCLDELGR